MDKRKEDVEKIVYEIPRVTRECLIRHQVHNSLEIGGFSKAADTITQLMDTAYIENVGQNFLIFNYSNGSVGFPGFVLQFSKQKADVLSNSNIDTNYHSTMEKRTSMSVFSLDT